MAKEDITQRLLSEIKSLNETNTSLKDAIKDYARTTANAMASNASAAQAINQTTSSLTIWTDLFESIKNIVEDLKKTNIVEDKNTGTNVLTGLEKGRYADIAKVFDSVLKVRSISKLLSTKTKISETKNKEDKVQVEKETEEERYRNIGIIFNKIMNVSSISTQLESIKKILIKSELRQIESENDRNRSLSFKSMDDDGGVTGEVKNGKQKDDDQKENKKSWITSFIEKIPIIGDVFRIARGITKLLFHTGPVIAFLTHFLTDDIAPWQGGVDLLAKFKLLRGTTFVDLGKAISEKFKSLIELPMKFIEEKFPKLFAKIAPKSAESLKPLTGAAEKLLEAGTKGGFFAKLLRFGSGSLKFLARVPILGSILSAYFAYDRYKEGDYVGMLIEIANIVASAIPGYGVPFSIGLGIIQAIRDWTRTPADKKQLEINKQDGFIKWMVGGIGDMLGSIIDFVVGGVKKMCDWVGSIFGFVKKDIESIKLPNTPQGVQEYYDKQIDELNRAAKSATGRSSLNAKKVYLEKANKLEQEKQKALQNYKLPDVKQVGKTPEITLPQTPELKTRTTPAEINVNVPNEEKNWQKEYDLLTRQLDVLNIIADNIDSKKFQKTNVSTPSMMNDDVSIIRQKSNTRDNFFNSVNSSTVLVGGVR